MFDPLSNDYEILLPKLNSWLHEHGVKSTIQLHAMYKEFVKMPKELKEECPSIEKIQSKYQIIATGKFGEISAIQGGCSFGLIEIYCLEGGLFEDCRRYKTVEDAGKTILSLLTIGMFDENATRAFDVFTDWINANPDGSVQNVDSSEFEEDKEGDDD